MAPKVSAVCCLGSVTNQLDYCGGARRWQTPQLMTHLFLRGALGLAVTGRKVSFLMTGRNRRVGTDGNLGILRQGFLTTPGQLPLLFSERATRPCPHVPP